ncbi:hypothetical protein GS449_14345 [Rhodococcus hoagii]|nr:hypothetical protein [Prescottella equi]
MTANPFDYAIAQSKLQGIADKHGLEDDQPWTVHGDRAGLVHRGDTRPDLLTHDLAVALYATSNDLDEKRPSKFVVGELNEYLAQLEPVTETHSGASLTYWRNVAVTP